MWDHAPILRILLHWVKVSDAASCEISLHLLWRQNWHLCEWTSRRGEGSLRNERNVKSNITWPNNTNVVTGSVFGNLYDLYVLPTLRHTSAQKTASVSAEHFNSQSVASFHYCVVVVTVLKTSTATISPPDRRFTLRQRPVHWCQLCNYVTYNFREETSLVRFSNVFFGTKGWVTSSFITLKRRQTTLLPKSPGNASCI